VRRGRSHEPGGEAGEREAGHWHQGEAEVSPERPKDGSRPKEEDDRERRGGQLPDEVHRLLFMGGVGPQGGRIEDAQQTTERRQPAKTQNRGLFGIVPLHVHEG
jgi:hypothetical protein